jgi:hypothetical protein
MRKILLVIAISFCGYAWAIEQHEISPQKPKGQAKTEQAGTERNPVTIKILPPQDAEAKATKEEEYRKEKSVQDEKLVDATVWLFRVTTALALFTFGLWFATVRLGRDAKKSNERQAREMERSLSLAEKQMALVGMQVDNAIKQTTIYREEYFSAHRPRLVVRRVSIIEDNGIFRIQYFVYNIGDSRATIVAISDRVWLPTETENLPAIPDYEVSVEMNTILESGHWMGKLHTPAREIQDKLAFIYGHNLALKDIISSIKEFSSGILFLGFIEYEDQIGTTRNTAFLRQFDFKTERFNPINHPDYEFQD